MINKILEQFSYREKVMWTRLGKALLGLFSPASFGSLTRLIAAFVVIAELLGAIMFQLPLIR